MSMRSEIVKGNDLANLLGVKTTAEQIAVLKKNNLPFIYDAKEKPVILKGALLTANLPGKKEPKNEEQTDVRLRPRG